VRGGYFTCGDAVRAVALDDFARIGGPVALIVGFVQIILAVIQEDGIRSSNGLERRKQALASASEKWRRFMQFLVMATAKN
jgi:hypothetical protein